MLTRSQFDRYLPPGVHVRDDQWPAVQTWLAATDALRPLGLTVDGAGFGLALIDVIARAGEPAGDGPMSRAAAKVRGELGARDIAAGRTRESTPPRVLTIADRVLADLQAAGPSNPVA